jgi:4-hydroxy-tetrahydrodipicolinate synthase
MFLLHQRLFCEANPIPVKWALHRMGRIGPGMRLPLVPLNAAFHERVLEAMRSADIPV